MRNTKVFRSVTLLTLITAVAACSGIQKATTPTGTTWPTTSGTPDSAAIARQQDSIRMAMEAARQDSINQARMADSIRAAQEAANQLASNNARAVLSAAIYFAYNSSDLSDTARTSLDGKASVLRDHSNIRVRITGHADDRGSDEYNMALSLRRAAEAKRYLVSNGVDEGRIEVTSMGEEQPSMLGDTEEAWSRNRRAEFEILSGA